MGALLILLGFAAASTSQLMERSSLCSTGIRTGDVCCAKKCGQCGGKGCGKRPGGSFACCGRSIMTSGRSCSSAPPPCNIEPPTEGPTPIPRPSSTSPPPSMESRRPADLCIIVMTKDDMNIMPEWIIYHGNVFGFHNLYVFDGSRDQEQINFLSQARRLWGVHVRHKPEISLDQAAEAITRWFHEFRGQCDWLVKVDSDEFMAHYKDEQVKIVDTPIYLSSLPRTGQCLRVGLWAGMLPKASDVNILDSTSMMMQPGDKGWGGKIVADARTFKNTDLGAHKTKCKVPGVTFDNSLFVVHYNLGHYDNYLAKAIKAAVGHGFMSMSDLNNENKEVLVKHLEGKVGGASGHKVQFIIDSLRSPKSHREAYYNFAHLNYTSMTEVKEFVDFMVPKYLGMVPNLRKVCPSFAKDCMMQFWRTQS